MIGNQVRKVRNRGNSGQVDALQMIESLETNHLVLPMTVLKDEPVITALSEQRVIAATPSDHVIAIAASDGVGTIVPTQAVIVV